MIGFGAAAAGAAWAITVLIGKLIGLSRKLRPRQQFLPNA
jgi:hypothetical protein